jgi:adenosylmethionine-8-amino-7-oxononanoate aminotransferase
MNGGKAMKDKSFVIKPHLLKELPMVSHGKGIYLYDREGKEYIDGSSGAVCASIGHSVKEIVQAMTEQANKVSFTYRSQFTSQAAERLAVKLSEWAPGDVNWSFFVNSGSEATETAMKIAIQYWQEKGIRGKNKVISRWMSYHGITLGALSMSGHVLRRKRFVPLLEDLPSASPPYCYRCPFHRKYPDCELACAKELEGAIERIGEENVAAFIAEPIIGAAGGAVVPPDGYYQEIRRICDQYNILFIADEVMTGMGRTGEKFAIDHWGVTPDIIVLGKGMSAGYTPMAAAMVSERVIETIAAGSASIMSGHTYSANPQSAAVSLAVIEYMEKHKLVENAREAGVYLKEQLLKLQRLFPLIGDVRGLGLLLGIEFVAERKLALPFRLELGLTDRVITKAMNKGLLLYPAVGGLNGKAGDSVIIAPPLTIKKEEIDRLITTLATVIKEVYQELKKEGVLLEEGDRG